jgi:hypothetical protein
MNKNPKTYTIVTGETTRDLSREVQEHLDSGWDLQGGVSYYTYEGALGFAQALWKCSNGPHVSNIEIPPMPDPLA